ncbi:MAG: thiolase family protein [Deltaproteobacteria bacterium]|nr:thiolase family protein [Deltaproteobacteria bacterium]
MPDSSNHAIVFVAAKRTPFGSFGGSLRDLTATDLAVHATLGAMKEIPGIEKEIDHVIFGNVIQTSRDAAYLARHVGLRTNLSISVPAVTVNRLCASGFEAMEDGIRRLRLKEASVVLVGGTENMSQSPYVLRNARFGHKFGHSELEDSLMTGLFDTYAQLPMALTAENLATQYNISRTDCDHFALHSQQKATAASESGQLAEEIVPISINERGKFKEIFRDEHIRKEASLESLQKLKPVFKSDGVVTAGNASGMVDGAAALIVTTKELAQSRGWPILGEWMGSHVVGCDPKTMGLGPVPAIQGVFKKLGLSKEDISRFEINEAFAPQVLACQKLLEIPENKLNTEGGAIAIGHPLGASGARLICHLLYSLRKLGPSLGCASACIGGGQGMAVLIRV